MVLGEAKHIHLFLDKASEADGTVPVMGGASEADSIYLVLNEPVKLVIMILSCTLNPALSTGSFVWLIQLSLLHI
jgi:hypothetical protein